MHVPAPRRVTTPVDAPIVHTPEGEAVYVTVPAPAEGVPTAFGGESASVYDAAYEFNESVRDAAEMVNVRELADFASYVESAAMDASIVHDPASTKETSPEEESTVQTDVVSLV